MLSKLRLFKRPLFYEKYASSYKVLIRFDFNQIYFSIISSL